MIATPDEKQFNTVQAKFAFLGHELHRTTRASDERVTYVVSRWGSSRTFNAWHDVLAFLTQVGAV